MKLSTIIKLQQVGKWHLRKHHALECGYNTLKSMLLDYDKNYGGHWHSIKNDGSLQYYCDEKPTGADIECDLKMVAIPTKLTRRFEIKCHSHCAKWGPYNPHNHIILGRFRTWRGLSWQDVFDYDLGHTKRGIRNSEYYVQSRRSKDVVRELLVFPGNKKIAIGYIVSSGKTEYHADTISAARKGLAIKLKLRRENARKYQQKIRAKRSFGHVITRKMLIDKFGWCETGVEDFISTTLPELKSADQVREKTLKRLLRNRPVKSYRSEVAELKMFLRHA